MVGRSEFRHSRVPSGNQSQNVHLLRVGQTMGDSIRDYFQQGMGTQILEAIDIITSQKRV